MAWRCLKSLIKDPKERDEGQFAAPLSCCLKRLARISRPEVVELNEVSDEHVLRHLQCHTAGATARATCCTVALVCGGCEVVIGAERCTR